MTTYQLLDKEKHKNIKVKTQFTTALNCNVGAVIVMDCELLAAQREYPIIFRKDSDSGKFLPFVLLGFKHDENLFIDQQGNWNANHIPMVMAKGPFATGFQDIGNGPQPSACINLEDLRVNETEGEALFEPDGSLTRYMEYVSQILLLIHQSQSQLTTMVDLFVELELLEPLRLDIQFRNGDKLAFQGGYTIAAEKLTQLDGAALSKLHKSNFLAAAYYISNSIDNIQKLIDLKNDQLS